MSDRKKRVVFWTVALAAIGLAVFIGYALNERANEQLQQNLNLARTARENFWTTVRQIADQKIDAAQYDNDWWRGWSEGRAIGQYWKPKAAHPTHEQLRSLARNTGEALDAQDPEVFERAYVAGFAKSYRDE
ncbi:MAG TPA: hypothetical protein VFX07_14405 [Candidatus Udaeobacter sp.]|nr:hypothetical protein [Candidatus Udaeobacter sp.]HEX5492451.1 hypothetical protein [Candidatus Udaeobacter sp.]